MKVRDLIGFDQYMAKVRAASDTVRAAVAPSILTDHFVATPFGLPFSSTLDSFGGLVIEPMPAPLPSQPSSYLIAPEDIKEAEEIMETLEAAQPGLGSILSLADPWDQAYDQAAGHGPLGTEIRHMKYRLLRLFPYLTTTEAWEIAMRMVAAARRAD